MLQMNETYLWCDISTGNFRLFIPKSLRKTIFDNRYYVSYPSIKATCRLICKNHVWSTRIQETGHTTIRSKSKSSETYESSSCIFPVHDTQVDHVHIDIPFPLFMNIANRSLALKDLSIDLK